MKANLITETKEIVIRDLSVIEKAGIRIAVKAYEDISLSNDIDEETGLNILVLKSQYLIPLFKFLSFSEIPVTIIA